MQNLFFSLQTSKDSPAVNRPMSTPAFLFIVISSDRKINPRVYLPSYRAHQEYCKEISKLETLYLTFTGTNKHTHTFNTKAQEMLEYGIYFCIPLENVYTWYFLRLWLKSTGNMKYSSRMWKSKRRLWASFILSNFHSKTEWENGKTLENSSVRLTDNEPC